MVNDLWISLEAWSRLYGSAADLERRVLRNLDVVARLRPDVNLADAESELALIGSRWATSFPGASRGATLHAQPARSVAGRADPSVLLLGAGVLLVLAIGGVNASTLLVGFADARRSEMGMRQALGASRSRIVRQVLAESALLATAGAVAGLFLAEALVQVAPALLPPSAVAVDYGIALDRRALSVAAVLTVLATLAGGLVPALRASRIAIASSLRVTAEAPTPRRLLALPTALVALQVALAVVALNTAGLLLSSFDATRTATRGFNTSAQILVLQLAMGNDTGDRDRFSSTLESLRAGALGLPGVRNASYVRRLPMADYGGGAKLSVALPGGVASPREVRYNQAGPDLVDTLGLRVTTGRFFEPLRPACPRGQRGGRGCHRCAGLSRAGRPSHAHRPGRGPAVRIERRPGAEHPPRRRVRGPPRACSTRSPCSPASRAFSPGRSGAMGHTSSLMLPTPRIVHRLRGRTSAVDLDSESGRAFLQERIAFFNKVVFWISGSFFVVAVLAAPYYDRPAPPLLHAATLLVSLAAWQICRRGPALPLGVLEGIDVGAVVLVLAGFAAQALFVPPAFTSEVARSLVLILTHLVVVRAVLVPSTALRTAGVSLLAALPVAAVIGLLPGPPGAAPVVVWNERFWSWLWTACAVVVAALVSHVIYGLRAEIQKARHLGQYTLEEKLGEGGMGSVYRARHAMLRRPTAIKLLPPGEGGRGRARALRARGAAHRQPLPPEHRGRLRLRPHARRHLLLRDGVPGGHGPRRPRREHGPQPPARVAHVLRQVACALVEAHGIGLIHRDIKPENIILCERGGIARRGQGGRLRPGADLEPASGGEADPGERHPGHAALPLAGGDPVPRRGRRPQRPLRPGRGRLLPAHRDPRLRRGDDGRGVQPPPPLAARAALGAARAAGARRSRAAPPRPASRRTPRGARRARPSCATPWGSTATRRPGATGRRAIGGKGGGALARSDPRAPPPAPGAPSRSPSAAGARTFAHPAARSKSRRGAPRSTGILTSSVEPPAAGPRRVRPAFSPSRAAVSDRAPGR